MVKNKHDKLQVGIDKTVNTLSNLKNHLIHNKSVLNSLPLPVEMKLAEGKGENELPKVNILGYTGESVNLSDYGVEHPVVYNTAGITFKNRIPYLYEHWDPIGHAENIKVSNHQLTATGVHSDPGDRSRRVAAGIENGVPYQSSMGLRIKGDSVTFHAEGSVVVNGKEFQAPIYVVNKSELVELTAALFGRDGDTSITSLSEETLMLIENSKKASVGDVPPQEPKDSQVDNQQVPNRTDNQQPSPQEGQQTTQVVPSSTQNSSNVTPSHSSEITVAQYAKLSAKYPTHLELIANMVDEGKSYEQIENGVKLAELENSNPPLPQSHRADNTIENAFTARMALSFGLAPETIATRVGQQATDHALSQGGMGLKEMLTLVANAEGGRFTGHSDANAVCNFIKGRVMNMDFSTINFPNLMNRIAQWRMEEAWKIDQPWSIGKLHETRLPDFKPAGRIRPKGGQMWDTLNKDGKLQHASFGEEVKYQVQTENRGQIITFKWEDIVNDDVGIINEMLDLMVEGALMIPDYQLVNVIYQGRTNGFLVNGETLFDLELTRENLEIVYNAVKMHTIAKGDQGVKTRFNTRFRLVTGPALERTAWELINQQVFVTGTEFDPQGQRNYWYQRFDLDVFDQLDNDTYVPDADPYAWGLIPVRQQYAPYTMAFLGNMTRPTTEPVDLPGDMLGFGVRGYWPIKVQEREKEAVAWSFPGSGS